MGRHRKDKEQPLSDYWKPPADGELEGGVGEPVACLATTFEFDASFFEAELLPRFLCLHFDHTENERTFIVEREEALAMARIAVLVDISKFDPRQTTLRWDQLPIQVPGGIQHGKLTFLVWERMVRLILASANLTRPGYRRNRELFAAVDFFDGADSAPLKPLRDALDFIEVLSTWSRALPAATKRIRETVKQVRMRVRGWSNAPQDFRPRERPRVNLVVGHPKGQAVPARSVADQLLQFWGQRRANSLTVITPFAEQTADKGDAIMSRMRNLPTARDARGLLVVPEAPTNEGKKDRVVPLPKHFGQCWKRHFGQEAYVLPVPRYVEGEDDRPRDLHAKAVLIQGDSHDLLMIGSSNFTLRGMGVGAFNCEANLAFEDWARPKRDGLKLKDRLELPVPWESAVSVDDVVWQQPDQTPEDAPLGKPHLPVFFAWASYSQRTGEIHVILDRRQLEPAAWTISLEGQSAEPSSALFSRAASPAEALTLCYTLDEMARSAHLTALRVSWQDKDESRHEGFLAVSVEDREADLLPPEEFRNLTVDSIIECLLSGREPAEWIERQDAKRKRTPSTDAALESLRAVDTSNYPLYRVRRFGWALAAMADRIRRTPPTPDAIRYRLLRDPLGPVYLADALCHDGDESDGKITPAEREYRLYVLAEMVLSLGYVGRPFVVGPSAKWITPIFFEAHERLRTRIHVLREQAGTLPNNLNCYLDTVFDETERLWASARRTSNAG